MSNDPLPERNQPVIYSSPRLHDWGTALIVACFALGFMMSWASYEIHQRIGAEQNVSHYRHDLDDLAGQQSDLGSLMADPQTKFLALTASDGPAPFGWASVAWNQRRQRGVVFCENLAAQGAQRYQVWLIPLSGSPTAVAIGPAEPGRSVYPFSPTQPADQPRQIVLTQWNQSNPGHQPGPALAGGQFKD